MQVRRISQLVLKREHAFIDTVGLGCVETPAKVYYYSGNQKRILLVLLNFYSNF